MDYRKEIASIIEVLSNRLGKSYSEENFFQFAKHALFFYENLISENSKAFDCFLVHVNEMLGKSTGKRFINLIKKINCHCLSILSKSYKGDILSAAIELRLLLAVPKYTDYKLIDSYANYLIINCNETNEWYRCVDFQKDEIPNSCNHVPFDKRCYASKGRFNQLGTPCLYLSSSLKCAQLEVGEISCNKSRWYGVFVPNQKLFLADFTVPTPEEIDKMEDYQMFAFLITYPLRLLSLVRPKNNDCCFVEEYLFSQLFFHLLFFSKQNKFPSFHGIRYSSVRDNHFVNLVIPAMYEGCEPPTNGFSENIAKMVTEKEFKQLI